MVKAYLRYVEQSCWGLITTGGAQVLPDPTGRYAMAPALESVLIWSIKTGELVRRLRPEVGMHQRAAEVTALALSADADTLAVGYSDGSVRLWSFKEGAERVALNGHRSAVTTLRFSADGALLVSGGHDTMVVIWDVVGEAGICKLRGHKGPVTDVCLLQGAHALATVSKDGMLKIWDLHTQHCVQTAAAPSGELWSLDLHATSAHILTGGAGGEVLIWRLEMKNLAPRAPAAPASSAALARALGGAEEGGGEGGGEGKQELPTPGWNAAHAVLLGQLPMPSGAHVVRIRCGVGDSVVGVQFADRALQLLSAADAAELKKRQKRREARLKKRAAPPKEEEEAEAAEGAATSAFQPLTVFRTPYKLQSFAFLPVKGASGGGRPASTRLLVSQRNNSIGIWECELKLKGSAVRTGGLEAPGHRMEPRSIAMSGDDRQLVSTADGEAKVWSVGSQQCLRTLSCGYGLSALFLHAGRTVLVGTKSGALQLFSVATGEMLQEIGDAHKGAVWSLALEPGNQGVVSASADKTIATWSVITPAEGEGGGTQSLEPVTSHTLDDEVLCARVSADGKYVAVALLDASVRVLFAGNAHPLLPIDTFKLFLTLYGHKLPVLSISISSDGALLVSGSADKTVKIWGLDFGDCHRSLLGHSDAVTSVSFVRHTHYFFSASKDGLIKYWDGDTFQPIHTLRGHLGEVWSLGISRNGATVASVSRDRSLRLWRRSDEQVFIEEQKEAELEGLLEAGLEKQQQGIEAEAEEAAALGQEGVNADSAGAGRRSLESIKGAERVLEALKVLDEEHERVEEHATALARFNEKMQAGGGATDEKTEPPRLVPNMLLLGLDQGSYLLKALSSVRTAELEQALMLIPFDVVPRLLRRLLPLLEEKPHIELMARCVCFVLRVHHKQIVANQSLLELLRPLEQLLRSRLSRERSILGYNIAALGFVKRIVEDESNKFFVDAVAEMEERARSSSTAELRRKTAAREGCGRAKKRKGRN